MVALLPILLYKQNLSARKVHDYAIKSTARSDSEGPRTRDIHFGCGYNSRHLCVAIDEGFEFRRQFTGWRRIAGSRSYSVRFSDENDPEILNDLLILSVALAWAISRLRGWRE